jgi:hypothetical protein
MFTQEFSDLAIVIKGETFPVSIDGECDVLDYSDAWEPKIVEIRLGSITLKRTDGDLFRAISAGIMETWGKVLQERFDETVPNRDRLPAYAAEHRLSNAQMGV